MKKPYIGVTGFMTGQEVRAALRCMSPHSHRNLMVGVLINRSSLTELTGRLTRRYPKLEYVSHIFQVDERAFNIIHYSSLSDTDLADQLLDLIGFVNSNLVHGFQLNMAWPKISEIEKFQEATSKNYCITLSVNQTAITECKNDPVLIAQRVAAYGNMVDYVLIDQSEGTGSRMDVKSVIPILNEITQVNPDFLLAVAGGLGPDRLDQLLPVIRLLPDISIDAESVLRESTSEDLDVSVMCEYLRQAQNILK